VSQPILKSMPALAWTMPLYLLAATASAQSLDEAVTDQLRTLSGLACANLIGTDSFLVLQNGLLEICARPTAVSGSPGASSSGAGASTSSTTPGVIQGRLQTAAGKEAATQSSESGQDAESELAVYQFGHFSLYVSAESENLDRQQSDFADAYDSDLTRYTLGADASLGRQFLLGVAIVDSSQDGDYRSGGDFSVDTTGGIVYASWMPTEAFYLQGFAEHFNQSNERQRAANFVSNDVVVFSRSGTPQSEFDSSANSLGLMAGYGLHFNNLAVEPRLGLNWSKTKLDAYQETDASGLALNFYDDEITSLQSSLEVQGSAAISTGAGVLSPQLSLAWKHEFDNDQRELQASFVDDTRSKRFSYFTDQPDRTFFEVGAGVVWIVPNGVQAFLNYNQTLANDLMERWSVSGGLRVEL